MKTFWIAKLLHKFFDSNLGLLSDLANLRILKSPLPLLGDQ